VKRFHHPDSEPFKDGLFLLFSIYDFPFVH
jgi:hypothetical protein